MGAMAYQITILTIVNSNCLFRRRSKKTSKLRLTGLCVGNSPVTGEFRAQMARIAENVSIWWCDHDDVTVGLPMLSLTWVVGAGEAIIGMHYYFFAVCRNRGTIDQQLDVVGQPDNVTLKNSNLQCHHVTGNSNICSTDGSCKQHRKHQGSTLLALYEWNPLMTTDFLRKSVIRQAFPCKHVINFNVSVYIR